MTLAKLTADTADAILASKAPDLAAAQDAYFTAQVGVDQDAKPILRGKYERTAPVKVGSITYEVHEYDGPQGKGYILHAWLDAGGKLYHRQQDFGPEGRTHGWDIVPS